MNPGNWLKPEEGLYLRYVLVRYELKTPAQYNIIVGVGRLYSRMQWSLTKNWGTLHGITTQQFVVCCNVIKSIRCLTAGNLFTYTVLIIKLLRCCQKLFYHYLVQITMSNFLLILLLRLETYRQQIQDRMTVTGGQWWKTHLRAGALDRSHKLVGNGRQRHPKYRKCDIGYIWSAWHEVSSVSKLA